MLKYYILYLLSAKNEHSIHSPFVFELYTKIIKKKDLKFDFDEIESLRKELLKDNTEITITDFGAGSRIYKDNQRKVHELAKTVQKPKKYGQLIYHLVQHFKPRNIIDLGTSLGLTTLYQSKAYKESAIKSFEGCPETAKIAQRNFDKLNAKNVKIVIGNIDETLEKTIDEIESIDFAFFDANHRYEPTINYYKKCIQKANEGSFFIFDDIHWSEEMHKAWKEITLYPEVMISIDLFYIGIIFFRKNQPKSNYILRF